MYAYVGSSYYVVVLLKFRHLMHSVQALVVETRTSTTTMAMMMVIIMMVAMTVLGPMMTVASIVCNRGSCTTFVLDLVSIKYASIVQTVFGYVLLSVVSVE